MSEGEQTEIWIIFNFFHLIFKNWNKVKISFSDSRISLLAVKFLLESENVEHFLSLSARIFALECLG